MTRATLLRLLAHPTALNGADVRALEELAEAFPYCQTAHLLLAKAAHDQGSMLAGQRLRRAATYAADRGLLRQLVEAAPVQELAEAGATQAVLSVFAGSESRPGTGWPDAPPTITAQPDAPMVLEDRPAQEIGFTALPAPADLPPAVENKSAAEPMAAEADLPDATTQAATPAASPAPTTAPATAPEALDLPVAATAESSSAEIVPAELAPADPIDPAAEAAIGPAATDEAAAQDELPPQAPPIRPPATAEAAHQEFGLAPENPAELMAYQLPALAVTIPLSLTEATPRLPPFGGVADVAYAPAEGSRFGYCLVPAGADNEAALSQMPAARLPLAGDFFAPDALVLSYLAEAPALPTSSTNDLINSFLQRSPAATRRRGQPPTTPSQQADLSVRSTRAAPDLASESLANILVKQGKTEQAIAIYERLMVKNPEKMAYFAAQIDLLRP